MLEGMYPLNDLKFSERDFNKMVKVLKNTQYGTIFEGINKTESYCVSGPVV